MLIDDYDRLVTVFFCWCGFLFGYFGFELVRCVLACRLLVSFRMCSDKFRFFFFFFSLFLLVGIMFSGVVKNSQNSVGMVPWICLSPAIDIWLDDQFADGRRHKLELVKPLERHLNKFFSMRLY